MNKDASFNQIVTESYHGYTIRLTVFSTGTWQATVDEMPDLIWFSETQSEAIVVTEESISITLEQLIKDKKRIPQPISYNYLLFCGYTYYPFGGISDYRGSFKSIEDAKNAWKSDICDWCEIVDEKSMTLIYSGEHNNGRIEWEYNK